MHSQVLLEAAHFGEGVPAVLAPEKGFMPSLEVAPLPASTTRACGRQAVNLTPCCVGTIAVLKRRAASNKLRRGNPEKPRRAGEPHGLAETQLSRSVPVRGTAGPVLEHQVQDKGPTAKVRAVKPRIAFQSYRVASKRLSTSLAVAHRVSSRQGEALPPLRATAGPCPSDGGALSRLC